MSNQVKADFYGFIDIIELLKSKCEANTKQEFESIAEFFDNLTV